MSETQTPNRPAQQQAPEWVSGQPYVPGTPIPPGAVMVSWENGAMTLEARADESFDPEIRRKTLMALDLAYEKLLKPTDESPNGRRPLHLLVNREFARWFPHLRQWGDKAGCQVIVEGDERRFSGKDAVVVYPNGDTRSKRAVKFHFVCDESE